MGMLRRLANWKEITATEYAEAYTRFGGSVATNPQVLALIAEHVNAAATFYGKHGRDGKRVAAVAAWDSMIAGDKEALVALGVETRFDLGTPEIIVPVAASFRGILPFHSKHLADLHASSFTNLSTRNRNRSLCLAKPLDGPDAMSARSCQKRRNEVRRFLDAGGEIRAVTAFAPNALADIYGRLFEARWQRPHPQLVDLPLMMEYLRDMLRGHVLLLQGEPCAYQFLLANKGPRGLSVEFVNGGVDPGTQEHSPGSVLTWLNIEAALNEAQAADVPLRYSFGRNSGDYKSLWAKEHTLLRAISF
jgi:hypothetical protein